MKLSENLIVKEEKKELDKMSKLERRKYLKKLAEIEAKRDIENEKNNLDLVKFR